MKKTTYIFVYGITLKNPYTPTCEDEAKNEIEIKIEMKNRATADRAIKAMLTGTENKIDYTYCER